MTNLFYGVNQTIREFLICKATHKLLR